MATVGGKKGVKRGSRRKRVRFKDVEHIVRKVTVVHVAKKGRVDLSGIKLVAKRGLDCCLPESGGILPGKQTEEHV